MPTVRIPLVGSFNQRSIDGTDTLGINQDQRFLNATFNVVRNPATGTSVIYVEKRPGWQQDSVVSSGIASTGLLKPQNFDAAISAFGESDSALYFGTTHIGNITGRAIHFQETLISASTYALIRSSDGSGWFYAEGAKDLLSYTGHTSSGGFRVSTLSDTSGLYVGQLVTGSEMGAGARISSVSISSSTIGLTVAATATSTGALLTKEPIAKIIDTNFLATGVYRSSIVPMDGYHFYATDDGYLNNSDLNTVVTWPVLGRLAVQQSPDPTVAVAVQQNTIVVLGTNSKEVFQNVGYPSGSPMQRVQQLAERIGCIDQRSLTQIEDDIYFVSTPYEGDVGVYLLRGLRTTRISTPNVDRIIGTAAVNGAIYANSFRLGGYTYAAFVTSVATDGPSSSLLLENGDILLLESDDELLLEDTPAQTASFIRTLIYNTILGIWAEWNCPEATFIDSVASGTNNQLLATSRFRTDGKVYKIDPAASGVSYQDDGVTISTEIRTSKIDFGTNNRKFVEELNLIADTVSTGTVTVYYSDDDYATWKGGQTIDLSKKKKRITRLGSHYDGRAYRFVHTDNAPFRAEAVEITYTQGSS